MNTYEIEQKHVEGPNLRWIVRDYAGFQIRQRNSDGFLSATDMCKVGNKQFKDYRILKRSLNYIKTVEQHLLDQKEIPPSGIIEINNGGTLQNYQGTWIHPLLAIDLAMWINPEFNLKVIQWVNRYLNGDITLVADVVEQHDRVYDTISSVVVNTVDSTNINNTLAQQIELAKSQAESARYQFEIRKLQTKEEIECALVEKATTLLQSESLRSDAKLYTYIKDKLMNDILTKRITNQVSESRSSEHGEAVIERKWCPDFKTIVIELGFPATTNTSYIGKLIKKKFQERYGEDPPTTEREVNGAIRHCFLYPIEDREWIEEEIRTYLNKKLNC